MKTLHDTLFHTTLRSGSLPILVTAIAFLTPDVTISAGDLAHPLPPPHSDGVHGDRFIDLVPLPDFFVAEWKPDSEPRGSHDRREDRERDDRDEDRGEDRERDNRREGSQASHEMAMLDRLLAMPPEQLARIRHAIERIEAMTPEEREALRERLRNYREITPEQRREMRRKWRELSPEERRDFIEKMRERHWQQVFEEEKAEEAHPKADTQTEEHQPAQDESH